MTIPGKSVAELVFLLSCCLTIILVLRRPYLYVRLGMRNLRIETYFIGAFAGPLLLFSLGILSSAQILRGLSGDGGLRPLGILALFLSMVFMSIFLDITGFFECCARAALNFAGNDGRRLFFALYGIVSILTIFTSNDIIILTFTPFVYHFAKAARIDPKPFLIAEFFAANTWSMVLYIGNPTNILLASAFGLTFTQYTTWMVLPAVTAGVVTAVMLYLIFRKQISAPMANWERMRPRDALTDRTGALLGIVTLGGCIVALSIGPRYGVDMWKIALGFAAGLLGVLLLRDSYAQILKKRLGRVRDGAVLKTTIKRMPWTVVPFVLSFFVTVEGLRIWGVTASIGEWIRSVLGEAPVLMVWVYGVGSALSANILNNIPMTVAFASIMQGLTERSLLAAVLATVAGSNLGANLTPLGALAGIMWMTILRGKEFHLSFGEFVRCGLKVTPPALIACLGVLALQFGMGW